MAGSGFAVDTTGSGIEGWLYIRRACRGGSNSYPWRSARPGESGKTGIVDDPRLEWRSSHRDTAACCGGRR
jgi:hypothetical protein